MLTDSAHTTQDGRAEAEARQLLAAIVDSSHDAIISTDLEGVVTSWNGSAERMFGYTAREIIGKPITMLFPPDRREEVETITTQLKQGNRLQLVETQRLTKSGEPLDLWLKLSPVRDSAGTITGIAQIARDISIFKVAERAALLLNAIVDSSDDAIISKDLNSIITSWNKSAERMFGYTAAETVGNSITMLIPPERLQEEPQIIARLKRGERVDHIETQRLRKDGKLIDLSLTISPVRDAAGNIIGASKIARDISSLKAADRTSHILSAIVDSSDDAIISKNLDGTIMSWNKSAERLFGYTAEEIIGRPITTLIPPDRLEEEPQIIAQLKRGERVDHIETQRVRKDGTLIDLSLTISPIKDSTGKVVGASKIARDISQRKLNEARQRQVENALRRANEDFEQFAFSASHDLQEPLRSVKIYSELLTLDYADAFTGEAKEYLRHLRTGASRMEMLVHDLLSYTQVAKYDRPAEPFPAAEAFSAALANLDAVIAKSNARVTAGELPALPVHGAHLQQLFQNVIGNAIKYRSPDREPVVHVRAVRADGHWLFSVSDNGIGIEAEYKETIFGLFKRLHTGDQYSGTGLGLAICQRIVERYHGRIWVESEPGKGSTFFFTFPI
jgi:PAS domain S-box-containing protein